MYGLVLFYGSGMKLFVRMTELYSSGIMIENSRNFEKQAV